MNIVFTVFTILALIALVVIWITCVVVHTRETVVKERLGKFDGVIKPGLYFFIPIVDKAAYRHEIREQLFDIPSQTCITRDNIQVDVDGVVYLKVIDPRKASYGVGNFRRAIINLAQTTMRSEIGKITLDNTFSERESINENIVKEIDKASEPWGIKMLRYEIQNITPSVAVIDTMEKQMEAERKKRSEITLATADKEARINKSEGERQESINISEGEKQKKINEAEGRSKEIALLAQATANGIQMISAAIRKPGGSQAVKMQITQQFIDELGIILKSANISVVPGQLANIKGVFEGIGEVADIMSDEKSQNQA